MFHHIWRNELVGPVYMTLRQDAASSTFPQFLAVRQKYSNVEIYGLGVTTFILTTNNALPQK